MTLNIPKTSIPIEDIPVLLTIFNRPDKVKAVIGNLRSIKPKRLYVAADGPRGGNLQDIEKCILARQAATAVDWSCEIKTRFLDENMGVDPAVSTAIEWFFQNVEYGIITEDDAIVHPDFFALCGELFVRYDNDLRIMQISSVFPYQERDHPYDYHFSRTFRCHGCWATWRRAWKHYIHDMRLYSDDEALTILKACNTDYATCRKQYKDFLEHKKRNLIEYRRGSDYYWDHWDFQWNLACAAQNGLSIVPEKNLLKNIGFGEDSTHTVRINPVLNLQVHPLRFPLRHPTFIYADSEPERSWFKSVYHTLSLKSRCMYLLRRALGAIHYLREVMPYR